MNRVMCITKRSMIPLPFLVLNGDTNPDEVYETRVSQLYISDEPLTAFKDRIEVFANYLDISALFRDATMSAEVAAFISSCGPNVIVTIPILKATSDKPILRFYRTFKINYNESRRASINGELRVIINEVALNKVCDLCERRGNCASEVLQTSKLRCIKNGALCQSVLDEEIQMEVAANGTER